MYALLCAGLNIFLTGSNKPDATTQFQPSKEGTPLPIPSGIEDPRQVQDRFGIWEVVFHMPVLEISRGRAHDVASSVQVGDILLSSHMGVDQILPKSLHEDLFIPGSRSGERIDRKAQREVIRRQASGHDARCRYQPYNVECYPPQLAGVAAYVLQKTWRSRSRFPPDHGKFVGYLDVCHHLDLQAMQLEPGG